MTLSFGKKCALAALGVFAVGAGLLFHRSPTPASPIGEVRKALTRRLPGPRGAGEHVQLLQSFEEKGPRVPTAATAADSDTRSREFAAHPSRDFHPAGALFEPTGNLLAVEPQEELLADAQGQASPLAPAPPRTHVVVDGDTLAKLAARYLGSSDRYGEIFAANRPLLTKPDLLPIGTQLTIPPRQRPAPPVELIAEDNPGTSPRDEDPLPRLDVETSATGSTNRLDPADPADDDAALAPVPKATSRERE